MDDPDGSVPDTDAYATEEHLWWHLARPSPELLAALDDAWLTPPGRVLDLGCGLGTEYEGEARRVLRPGGKIGLGYFGSDETCPDLEVIRVLQDLQAPADADPSRTRVRIADPGAAEFMLAEAGFAVIDRGLVETITEWPDPDIALAGKSAISQARASSSGSSRRKRRS